MGKVTTEVESFKTTTRELMELPDWLSSQGVTHLAMAATGVYWEPVWHILCDGEFELVLANAERDTEANRQRRQEFLERIQSVPPDKTRHGDADISALPLLHSFFRMRVMKLASALCSGFLLRTGLRSGDIVRVGIGSVATGMKQCLPVTISLVGVVFSKVCNCGVEASGSAHVSGDDRRLTGTGVAAGQRLATDGCVFEQSICLELLYLDSCLVIVELANEKVATQDCGPSQKRIRLKLHGALAVDDAAPLMSRLAVRAEIGRVSGSNLLLDLKEQRIVGAVALHVDAVIAQAHRSGTDDLESDV